MLGYDISWAAFNIIEVMSSTKFTFKVRILNPINFKNVIALLCCVCVRAFYNSFGVHLVCAYFFNGDHIHSK